MIFSCHIFHCRAIFLCKFLSLYLIFHPLIAQSNNDLKSRGDAKDIRNVKRVVEYADESDADKLGVKNQTKENSELSESGSYQNKNETEREFIYNVPKMEVNDFIIEGVTENKKAGISNKDINKIVEDARLEASDAFDIDSLRNLTDEITDYYRKKGYFLAVAYIPEQTIKDGIVHIRVLEGTLAEVLPEGNSLYSDRRLKKPLKPYIGQPVNQKKIETAMLHLNDYPGVKATAIFSPGEELGSTNVTIQATDENSSDIFLGFDNFGNEFTGEYRLRGVYSSYNPTGIADKIDIGIIQTFSPTNSLYGFIQYAAPIWKNGLSTGFTYSNNAYSVGDVFEDLGIEGESSLIDLFGRYTFKRSRKYNLFSRFGVQLKEATSTGGGQDVETSDELTVVYGSFGFDGDDDFFQGQHAGEFIISQGIGQAEEDMSSADVSIIPTTDDSFTKFNLNYTHSFPFENASNQYLFASIRSQFSSNALSSLEQLSLGGPHSVRAYSVSSFLVDTGAIINLEWVTRTLPSEKLDWTHNVQLSAFLDYATGSVNGERDLTSEGQTVTLQGIGAGIRLNPAKGYQVRFDFTFPIGTPEPNDDTSFGFLLNLGYKL